MRKRTFAAVFVSVLCVGISASAILTQRIQRTITEQAIEFVIVLYLVAGKILAFPVLKKLMVQVFFHHASSHLPKGAFPPLMILWADCTFISAGSMSSVSAIHRKNKNRLLLPKSRRAMSPLSPQTHMHRTFPGSRAKIFSAGFLTCGSSAGCAFSCLAAQWQMQSFSRLQ